MRSSRRKPTSDERAIGARLKALRVRLGLRPTTVADRLEMSEMNYWRYESGDISLGYLQIRDFARALGIEPHELFEALKPVGERLEADFRREQSGAFSGRWAALGAGA